MSIIEGIRNREYLYELNRVYINYNRTNYYIYYKDTNFQIVKLKSTMTNNPFKTIRNTVQKVIEGIEQLPKYMKLEKQEKFEDFITNKIRFGGFINEIIKSNANVTAPDFYGYDSIRYTPEINGLNFITKDFKLMEDIFFNNQLQLNISEEWKEYAKGGYLEIIKDYQIQSAEYFINHCTLGTQNNSRTTTLQEYRTMRLQPSMYPIFMRFSNDINLLDMPGKFNKSLLHEIGDNFPYLRVLETASLYGKLIKDIKDTHKGVVIFTTKKHIAEFLGVKSDFTDISSIMKIIVGKYLSGFFADGEKFYRIQNAKGETNILYHNQLCLYKLYGEALTILEEVKDIPYHRVIASEYMQNYNKMIEQTRTSEDILFLERFGGTRIFKEPSVEGVLRGFKEVLV